MEFIDLKAQQEVIKADIDKAIAAVLSHGKYILGPEVTELEEKLSDMANVSHCVACANGTDALVLSLRAKNIGAGDAVIVPSFTFAATAEAVVLVGATPVFVDIDLESFNIDPGLIESAVDRALGCGLKPKALIAVDLFGQPADYETLCSAAKNLSLLLIGDAAQSFGASYHGAPVGSLADITTTSFFPAKPLGCYGDGGAIFTSSEEDAGVLKSLRVHGKGSDKYDNIDIGYNSRLDTLQAAILLVKLKVFEKEIEKKNEVAAEYARLISSYNISQVKAPVVRPNAVSSWAQYTIVVDPNIRAQLIEYLKHKGIPTAVYYPVPLHEQTAYKKYPSSGNGLPNTQQLSQCALSLPMHAYMTDTQQEHIVSTIRDFFLVR